MRETRLSINTTILFQAKIMSKTKLSFMCLLHFVALLVSISFFQSCIKPCPYRILFLFFKNGSTEDVYVKTNFPRGLSENWTIGASEIMDNRPMEGLTLAGEKRLLYSEAFKSDIDAVQYIESLFPDGTVEVYHYLPDISCEELELKKVIQLNSIVKELNVREHQDVSGCICYYLTLTWPN